MAKFLETLAETGIVIDACDAAGKSKQGAYALRRRNPLFARAWGLALDDARDRLADTLLARSIEGNVEQIVKDDVIVAEKHYLDNRLGLAVLKRLDKRADEAATLRRPPRSSPQSAEPNWDIAPTALRTGDADDVATALALLNPPEVDQLDSPPIEETDTFGYPRIWREFQSDEWRTNYPPPPGFSGFEQDDWEGETYCRALSDGELAALIAAGIAEPSEAENEISIEDDRAERDAFFGALAASAGDRSVSEDCSGGGTI